MTVLRDLRFTPAPIELVHRGLLGWVRARIGRLEVDAIAVRRTARGHVTIAFPARRDARGRKHAVVRPVDRATREAIRRQILAVLPEEGTS